MKKVGLLSVLCLLALNAFSQVKFSLRLAPAVAMTRVTNPNSNSGANPGSNGSGLAFSGGPALDFFFSDNFAIGTGLNYISTQVTGKLYNYDFKRGVQYVQLPVTIKAYTNEIATNLKIYFQLGGTFNVKIAEKLKSSNASPDPDADHSIISAVDAGIYLGAGVLYKLGESNALFAGLYYNRGLTNIMHKNGNFNYHDDMRLSTDLLGIEAGFRF